MPAPLRHVLRILRLTLVCLALVWSSAPAAAAPVTDTIALIALVASGRDAAAERDTPVDGVTRTPEPVASASDGEPSPGPITATRTPSPPRRLYLEHRALLR